MTQIPVSILGLGGRGGTQCIVQCSSSNCKGQNGQRLRGGRVREVLCPSQADRRSFLVTLPNPRSPGTGCLQAPSRPQMGEDLMGQHQWPQGSGEVPAFWGHSPAQSSLLPQFTNTAGAPLSRTSESWIWPPACQVKVFTQPSSCIARRATVPSLHSWRGTLNFQYTNSYPTQTELFGPHQYAVHREQAAIPAFHVIPVLCVAALCFCAFRFAETAPSGQSAVPAARGFGQPAAAGGDPCGREPYDRPSDRSVLPGDICYLGVLTGKKA